ncbi:MAG: pirin family protein [Vicingaceae bacterium]
MTSFRGINKVVKAQEFQMGNIRVKQALPGGGLNDIDPFLLLHHAGPFQIKPGSNHKKLGVGPHPHRGFEPVSFVFKGSLQHRDSVGNNDVLNDGDMQWMTSGKGIIHSERPPKKVTDYGGTQEFIQLWVNLPGKHKLTEPSYQNIRKMDFPLLKPDKGNGEIQLISGKLNRKSGPAKTFTPILALKAHFKKGAQSIIAIESSHNALVYVVNGTLKINGLTEVAKEHMVHFNNDGESIEIEAIEDAGFLVLSGEPIREPVSTYGPFVMNTNDEIMSAIRDYQQGKMGELVENFD